MQYDEIINCPKSGGDLCYKLRVTDEITNYFSLSCGFWTNSLMTPGSDFFEEQIEMLPELYKDLSWVDEKTGLIWLPTTINEEQLGMVFANGQNSSTWNWAAVKARPLNDDELKEVDNKITHKPDMSTMQTFAERDFMEALSYIGLLPK
jgi:hypothetical protein|tara:strand:- start:6957 stop:7403 length:447 start_codon:yes stop_codon:yes gene_type:complete